MGIIFANPNGEVRGKIGSQVYSRNRYQAYSRSYVKPAQPNSNRQINSRNNFGSLSALYQALTLEELNTWSEFAKGEYKPRRKRNRGQYSGWNAFVGVNSLRMKIDNSIAPVTEMKINGSVASAGTGWSGGSFVSPASQIINKYPQNAFFGDNGTSQLLLRTANVHQSLEVEYQFSISPANLITPNTLQDLLFNISGFFVMISDSFKNRNGRPKNFNYYTAGVTGLGISAFPLGAGNPTGSFAIRVNPPGSFADYATFPTVGDYVVVSAYAYNTTGGWVRLGSVRSEVFP